MTGTATQAHTAPQGPYTGPFRAGRTELLAAKASPAGYAWLASRHRWRPARHLQLLASVLERAARPDVESFDVVEMPPRHGKSELTSKYGPAWYLSRWPNRRVMLASYEAGFASEWGRKARDTFAETAHLFGLRVHPDISARNNWEIQRWDGDQWVDTGGGMVTAGVGGPLTGRGAHWLIIDDPIKNWAEANSPVIREALWDWLVSTALTRLEDGGSATLVMTRWHHDDLAGRLENPPADDPDAPDPWVPLRLPAIAEDDDDPIGRSPGEALWPDKYSTDALDKIRRRLGPRVWAGLFQQRPSVSGGDRFKLTDFRRFRRLPDGSLELRHGDDVAETVAPHLLRRRFATMDLAITDKTSSDWTVITVFCSLPSGRLLVLDRVRSHAEAADHEALVLAMWERHDRQIAPFIVEATQYQASLVQKLRRARIPVRPIYPDTDKVTRALVAEALVADHQVWWPADVSWLPEWEDELAQFPNGDNDDQVDTLSYGALKHVGVERGKMVGGAARSWA